MSRMTSQEIEALLTCVLEKRSPIPFKTLSNLVFIVQSFFSSIELFLPMKFRYSPEGLISEELKFVIERLATKNLVEIKYRSPSSIAIKIEASKRRCPLKENYFEIIEQINAFLDSPITDTDIIEIAKLVRIQNIHDLGMIPSKELEKRISFDNIDINRINETVPLRTIKTIIPSIRIE